MTVHWGLDLGECELAAVKLSVGEGAPEVQEFAFAPIPCGSSGRGPAEKRAALTELVRRLHLRRAVIHAADPGSSTVLRDGSLRPEDLDGTPETVRRHLLELLPGDLGPREVRYEAHPGAAEGAFRLLSISREDVERSAALLAGADLRRSALHSGALALTAAAELRPADEGAFALLTVGARTSVLAIHDARTTGRTVERYRLPVGEEDLAAEVARSLAISTADAFARLAASDDGEVAAAQRPVLETLRHDVVRLLEYHRSRGDAAEVAAVYPVGAVAIRRPVQEALATVLPVRAMSAPEASHLRRTGRAEGAEFEAAYPRLVGAVGAALLGRSTRDHPQALRRLPPAPEPVRFGLHVAAAALLLFLVFAAWAVAVEDRRRVEAVERTQILLDERLPRESRSPARLAEERRRVETRAGLLSRKTAVFDAIGAVALLFPEPREGQSHRLARLELGDGTVRATLVVSLPRNADREAASETARNEALARLRARLGDDATVEGNVTPGGYVLRARWEVAP